MTSTALSEVLYMHCMLALGANCDAPVSGACLFAPGL